MGWSWKKTVLVTGTAIGGAGLAIVTGGAAAPLVGAWIGSSFLGLSGAAATSAGLAALGGGSLAAGGLGMAGGTAVVAGTAAAVSATSTAFAANKLSVDPNDVEKLQTIANDLRRDIQIIKTQHNKTTAKNTQTRSRLERELRAKDARLREIENILRA